ncbi:GNAT family N-acetyltransferase [Lihuaxuella thermophila]|uniref:Acetyltransferase (GNAT) domain-containing protein n=1 Tax=Lihuaxuella thermophila TaxID=1173111 RepID=A0A1H8J5N1_9BACL|nr:GNAT family N-acetyltransferase [Lihuaxuella thermophila]SEN75328.1 Acetyltransferase (GNAT) domain-containing protein [Lihuaxuella thermophila]
MPTILETERLILRPFEPKDAKTVQILAGDWEIADKIPPIPHPYPDGAAESWIEYLNKNDPEIGFAITRKTGTRLMGSISLILSKEHQKAEVGYWLGTPYWGNGYMTEACKRIIPYGFEELNLNK